MTNPSIEAIIRRTKALVMQHPIEVFIPKPPVATGTLDSVLFLHRHPVRALRSGDIQVLKQRG